MKKFSYKILMLTVIGLAVFSYSCNKSKLDLLPRSPTEAVYFSDEGEFTRSVLGIYAKMSDLYGRVDVNNAAGPDATLMPIYLLPGDDITTNKSGEEFEIFSSLQPSSGRVNVFYRTIYQLIARANVVLEKIGTVKPGVYTTANLKSYHEGEALFLRAFGHFYLWNYYGTAPINIARVTTTGQFTPPGTSGTQLLDQAIADFSKAATLLPASWNADNRGRVTKNSAYGFLGKSLVFKASATKTIADYTAAIAAFNNISGLILVPKFDDNFAPDTENNSESLFEFQASKAAVDNNVWLNNDFDNAIGNLTIDWNYYTGRELYGNSKFFATPKFLTSFDAADPRRSLTLNTLDNAINKYVLRDGVVDGFKPASINNYRILRLADIKLLQAEAILQSGGSTSSAIALVNEVRTRARDMAPAGTLPANYSTAETNKTTIMNWIIKERMIELGGEGQRWLDVRRWHMQGIITLDNAFFNSNVTTLSFQAPKSLVFPIPSSEIDVNPNIQQNPGY